MVWVRTLAHDMMGLEHDKLGHDELEHGRMVVERGMKEVQQEQHMLQ